MRKIDPEICLKLLRHMGANPLVTQRELAERLGVSLGKTNHCIRALVGEGLVEMRKRKNGVNKRTYLYLPTEDGLRKKSQIGASFLQSKIDEQKVLREEIAKLREQLASDSAGTE